LSGLSINVLPKLRIDAFVIGAEIEQIVYHAVRDTHAQLFALLFKILYFKVLQRFVSNTFFGARRNKLIDLCRIKPIFRTDLM